MMDYNKELNFFKKILKQMNIKVDEVVYPYTEIHSFDCEIHKTVYKEFDYPKYLKEYLESCTNNIVYKVLDNFYTNYITFILPNYPVKTHLIIGPYLTFPVTETDLLKKLEQLHIQPDYISIFKKYFKSLPLITDTSVFQTIITTLCEIIWGSKDNFIIEECNSFDLTYNQDLQVSYTYPEENPLSKIEEMEKRYFLEETLIQTVSQGQLTEIEHLISKNIFQQIEQRLDDPVRNAKNYAIIANTILRKAAQQGSVHPYYINKISSHYAEKIELLTSEIAAKNLLKEMTRKYTMLVKNHSLNGYSPIIRKVLIAIESDLASEQKLSFHAKRLNINPSYLSSIFKKETGMTLTTYVTKKRIQHAIFLLNTTTLEIQTIAEYCGIPDLCYFSNIFKKLIGMSPSVYRNTISLRK